MNTLTKTYNTHAALANDRLAIAAQVTERILTLKPTLHAICAEIEAGPEGFTLTTSAIVERACGRIYAGHDKAKRLLGCSLRKLAKLERQAEIAGDSFLAEAITEKRAQVEAADRALFRARIS